MSGSKRTPASKGLSVKLTPEEAAHITAQETYREEVRKSLSPAKTTNEKAWGFLNSAFGLWVLSSIVVGLVTWGYSTAQHHHEIERENVRIRRRLDLEIANRLDRFQTYLMALSADGKIANIMDLIREADDPRDQPYKMGVFAEFKGSSIRALLWQRAEVCDESDLVEVLTAYWAAARLEQISAGLSLSTPEAEKPTIVERIMRELRGPLSRDRWRLPPMLQGDNLREEGRRLLADPEIVRSGAGWAENVYNHLLSIGATAQAAAVENHRQWYSNSAPSEGLERELVRRILVVLDKQ